MSNLYDITLTELDLVNDKVKELEHQLSVLKVEKERLRTELVRIDEERNNVIFDAIKYNEANRPNALRNKNSKIRK